MLLIRQFYCLTIMNLRRKINITSLFSAFTLIILTSCGKGNKEAEETNTPPQKTPLEIADKGSKSLVLDYETDFQHLIDLQLTKFDGQEYLSFYNRNNHSIYQYDYASGELFKKIQMSKEGPNAVQMFFTLDYFFHSIDSIFINSSYYGIYLIDNEGNVIQKRPDAINPGQRREVNLKFDEATEFSNNQIHCRTYFSVLNMKEGPLHTRISIDMTSDKVVSETLYESTFINNYDEIRALEKEKGRSLIRMNQYFAQANNQLFASTPISDSVYVFRDSQLINTIYTGLPEFKITDYKTFMSITEIDYFKGGVQRNTKPVQPPQYGNMFIDPDGKYLYRILIHGTKAKFNENLKKDLPNIFGATLIAVNIETEETTSYELPIDEIELSTNAFSNNVFVSNAGIHFQVKDQENEDEIAFRVFGVRED